MQSDALLLIPPFLKTLNQPLLGPAMLAGAGEARGHRVEVVDLNQRFLRSFLGGDGLGEALPFVGDHNRPSDRLREVQKTFSELCGSELGPPLPVRLDEDPHMTLTYSHAAVERAAKRLAQSPWGHWARGQLASRQGRPDLVGVSVLFSGQVLFGLALSILAKARWPGVPVVWGGPHVTALQDRIAVDPLYGWTIDGFVFGYAEGTWVDLLDAVAGEHSWPNEVIAAGSGRAVRAVDDPRVVPSFQNLSTYGWGRLCLPTQASRGCAYGRCTFCTYPAVEGGYRLTGLDSVEAVVLQAQSLGAAVAFKDSLVVPRQLEAIASLIGGRVAWSACTKLHRRLDVEFLQRLAGAGCATLEVGLETLTESGQLLANKRQTLSLFLDFLDAAQAAGIQVIVNYMTGFPGACPSEEQRWLSRVREELACRSELVSKVEHNTFQLEARSPMSRNAHSHGIEILQQWPWASVVAWRAIP